MSYQAHGAEFKQQALLVSGTSQQLSWQTGQAPIVNSTFQDVSGTAIDALGRATATYSIVGDNVIASTFSYDGSGYLGSETQHCEATGQCSNLSYDAAGRISGRTYSDSTPMETYGYDADGRNVTRSNAVFGTMTRTLDADGRLTQVVEPSGGGLSSSANMTYHYYADGRRSAVDVSSSGLTQNGLFTYSYRDDGLLQNMGINYSADSLVGASGINIGYTNAGRISTRTETGTGANATPSSYSYDAVTGLETTQTLPAASFNNFSYDAEGEVLSYNRNVSGVSGSSGSFVYNVRGSVVSDPRLNLGTISFADNVPLTGAAGQTQTWDGRAGVSTGGGTSQSGSTTLVSSGVTYDAAGRQTGMGTTVTDDDTGNSQYYGSSRQYDSESRIVGGSQMGQPNKFGIPKKTLVEYDWGPDGHPVRLGTTPASYVVDPSQLRFDTLHWDGDALLFTTNDAGAVDDIKISTPTGGNIGDITPLDPVFKGITFRDDGINGTVFCHNATGAAGNDTLSASSVACSKTASETMQIPSTIVTRLDGSYAGGVGQGALVGSVGGFALNDGANIIAGGSNFDAVQNATTVASTQPKTTPRIYHSEIKCQMNGTLCQGGSPPTTAPSGIVSSGWSWIPGAPVCCGAGMLVTDPDMTVIQQSIWDAYGLSIDKAALSAVDGLSSGKWIVGAAAILSAIADIHVDRDTMYVGSFKNGAYQTENITILAKDPVNDAVINIEYDPDNRHTEIQFTTGAGPGKTTTTQVDVDGHGNAQVVKTGTPIMLAEAEDNDSNGNSTGGDSNGNYQSGSLDVRAFL